MPTQKETALITGASSGIGCELARVFAAHGSNLVLVARRREKLESLAQVLRAKHGVEVTALSCDLTEPPATQWLEDQLRDRGLAVDVLVNNAGFGAVGKFSELPIEHQLDMIRLNVVVLTDLTRRFLPQMLGRNHGAILNVASTAAFQPGPNMSVYFATKAYVLSLTEAIAHEVRDSAVQITCLCPGATVTEFGSQAGASNVLLFRLGPMTADRVAKFGYRALRRGKKIAVPGVGNWLVAFFVRFTPRTIVCRISERLVAPDVSASPLKN
jgi:short-subunit dehydrogenase